MGMEVYLTQASLGDCILIRCGELEKKVNIMIDSGLASLNLERSMNIINDHGEKIDMCVFTHDDNDHIQGAKNLINQIIKAKERRELTDNQKKIVKNLFGISSERMIFNFGNNVKNELLAADDMNEMIKVLLGQGIDYTNVGLILANEEIKNLNEVNKSWPNIIQLRWEFVNDELRSEIIRNPTDDDLETKKEHLELIILSPDKEVLRKYVENAWNDIQDIKLSAKKDEKSIDEWEESIQYWTNHENKIKEDTKLANVASIAFLIKYNGICGLLAGDANPDIMVKYGKKYLEQSRIDSEHINLDFMKLPHHGSSHNINKKFLEFFRTSTYLISTMGSKNYKHPGKITFAEIAKSKQYDKDIHILTNYLWWRNFEEWKRGDIVDIDENRGKCSLEMTNGTKQEINFIKLKVNKMEIMGGKLAFSM